MSKEKKLFAFTEIFTAVRGTRLIESEQIEGDVAYISSTKCNNGICSFINPPEKMVLYKNKITISNSGSVGYLFYHNYPFVASDHVTVIGIKEESVKLTENIALYLKPVFEAMRYKYNFGREISDRRIKREQLLLPVEEQSGQPDWEYMARYIQSIREKIRWKKIAVTKKNCRLDSTAWKDVKMGDIFDIDKGKRLTRADIIAGQTNFIGAISSNNGIREKISEEPLYEGNCITVNYNGSVGEAYYQTEPFWASDDVNVLHLKNHELNKYIALFLITVIRQNKAHFDFGRKWNLEKMRRTLIRVPVNEQDEINWEFMESYMKNLPLGQYI